MNDLKRTHYQGRRPRKRKPFEKMIPFAVAFIFVLIFSIPLIASRIGNRMHHSEKQESGQEQISDYAKNKPLKSKIDEAQELAQEAEQLTLQYNYDGAIEKLNQALKANPENPLYPKRIKKYEEEKKKLVVYDGDIYHVFFHQLIVDPSITFGEQNSEDVKKQNNNLMTTLDEFKRMLEAFYKKGYILVNYDQIYDVKTNKNGEKTFVKKELLLPKGRKPLIISQEDVNFYQDTTLEAGGYGQKYVLDQNGKIKVSYVDEDGKETVGDYDLLPVLESFVQEHVDFSYQGAMAYLGLTGYDGVFGYRIQNENKNSATYKEDVAMVKKIAKEAKKEGFLFASHSYAHELGAGLTVEQLQKDLKDWKNQVGKYVGNTNVYLIPYGNWWNNVGKSMSSADVMEKFNTIAQAGFDFIGGTGCDTFEIQYPQFIFMDRYNLDGFRLYNSKERLKVFFDSDKIWDSRRPGGLGIS